MHDSPVIMHAFKYQLFHILIYMELEKPTQVSSIRISHKAKSKLAKMGAKMTLKDGKLHSMEEVIDILMDEYERFHKE
jgi:hypothetical protein